MSESYLLVRVPKSGSNSLKTLMRQTFPDYEFVIAPNMSGQDQGFSLIEHLRSYRKFTRRAFKAHGVFTRDALWKKIEKLREEKNIIVSGHVPFEEIPNPGAFRLVTITRHPIARLVSEYKWKQHGFNKRGLIRQLYNRGRNYHANKSLADYVDFLADHAELYSNITTKYVTGSINHPDPVGFVSTNYWHYGLLEYSDIFAQELGKKAGVACSYPHNNTSPIKDEITIPPKVEEKFISFNEKDFELYYGLEKLIKERQAI